MLPCWAEGTGRRDLPALQQEFRSQYEGSGSLARHAPRVVEVAFQAGSLPDHGVPEVLYRARHRGPRRVGAEQQTRVPDRGATKELDPIASRLENSHRAATPSPSQYSMIRGSSSSPGSQPPRESLGS